MDYLHDGAWKSAQDCLYQAHAPAFTLPTSIQFEYANVCLRTGETSRLMAAKRIIAALIEVGPHRVEEYCKRKYLAFDGGYPNVVDNTEEIEYHGE